MILIKQIFLAFLGLCSGFAVAAGVFAFITMLGIIPRLATRTHTRKHILFYERAVIIGGTIGNLWAVYGSGFSMGWIFPRIGGQMFLGIFGLFSGIFVGCLAMALAEALRVFPILTNRIQLKEGFPYVVTALAAGKAAGTIFQYFF